jgi:hydrogenase maturation factor HypE
MKTLKVIGGFLLGWLLASAVTIGLIPQSEISRTTDIIGAVVSLCGGIIGGVITYKRVNLKKYED